MSLDEKEIETNREVSKSFLELLDYRNVYVAEHLGDFRSRGIETFYSDHPLTKMAVIYFNELFKDGAGSDFLDVKRKFEESQRVLRFTLRSAPEH